MFGKNNITYDKEEQTEQPIRQGMVPYGSDMPKEQEEIIRNNMNRSYQSDYNAHRKAGHPAGHPAQSDDIIHTRKGGMSRTSIGSDRSNYKGFDPADFLSDRSAYDPLLEHYHRNGLIGDSTIKKAFNYLHFDSRSIRRTPTIVCNRLLRLKEDPLTFAENMLKIYVENIEMFNVNDMIILNGIATNKLVMRTPIVPKENDPFQFTQDNDHLMITGTTNLIFNEVMDDHPQYTDMMVCFDGFRGDVMTGYLYDIAPLLTGRLDGKNGLERIVFFEKLGAVYYDGEIDVEHYDPFNRRYTGLIQWGYLEVDSEGRIWSMDSIENFYQNNIDLRWIDPDDEKKFISLPNIDFKRSDFPNLDDMEYPSINFNDTPITINRYMDWFKRMIVRMRTSFYDTITGIGDIFQKINTNFVIDLTIILIGETRQPTATIYNIPINQLNGSHQMYMRYNQMPIKKDVFYIRLQDTVNMVRYSVAQTNNLFVFAISERQLSDVTITYEHFGGVPARVMTTDHPIGFDSTSAFRQIAEINYSEKNMMILLDRVPYFGKKYFGGDSIYIGLVDCIDGEENQNNYVINFPISYSNITSIRIINSIIPKNNPLITDGRGQSIINNKFYWQNLYDGDHVYDVVMETGNYDQQQFIAAFEKKINNVERINSIGTRRFNYMTMNINRGVGDVSIVSYDIYDAVYHPLYIDRYRVGEKIVDPYFKNIITDYIRRTNHIFNLETSYFVKIYQPYNRMVVGDTVMIRGSRDYMEIPANHLNASHIVASVVRTMDIYYIVVENIDMLATAQSGDYRGIGSSIYSPCPFKIRFDFSGTIGNIIGFRDVGSATSITTYNHVHTNKELYDGEIDNHRRHPNHPIQFDGYPYLLMVVDELPNVNNMHIPKNYFYKINLPGPNETLQYDTFVDQPIYFIEPLKKLDRMTVNMMTPDNHPYQFNGMDHSYTLEIITFDESPIGTNIRSS